MTSVEVFEATSRVQLQTLGGLSLVRVTGSESHRLLGPGKPTAMLAYLSASPGLRDNRRRLKELFWADLDPSSKSADHAFRQAVWLVRRAVGADLLQTEDNAIVLQAALDVDRQGLLNAQSTLELEQAVTAYAGDYLADVRLPEGLEFEQWAEEEQYRLRRRFISAGVHVVRHYSEAGRHGDAKALAIRIRDINPLHQYGWRVLLECLITAGDTISAAVEAEALERMLSDDDTPPDTATRALLEQVLKHGDAPVHLDGDNRITAQLVGRYREFSNIVDAWQRTRHGVSEHVHVTAPAGIGKTRLVQDVWRRFDLKRDQAVVLRVNQSERNIQFSLAGDLAGAVGQLSGAKSVSPESVGHLVSLCPKLSETFGAVRGAAVAQDDLLRQRTMAVADLMIAVADEQAIAIIIDDLHWADDSSRRLLVSVIERCANHPVLFLTTTRPIPSGHISTEGTAPISLDPLSPDDTIEFLSSIARLPDTPLGSGLPTWLHRATDGSPLEMLQALQHAEDRGWLSRRDGVWESEQPAELMRGLTKGQLLTSRVRELNDKQLIIARLLAVAAEAIPHEDLCALVSEGDEHEHVESTLADLDARGLVLHGPDGWRMSHDALADVVVATTSGVDLASAHATLGRCYARYSSNPINTRKAAYHFLAADDQAQLRGLFVQHLEALRAHGDHYPVRSAAADLLGREARTERVEDLIASVPFRLRWRSRVPRADARTLVVSLAGVLAVSIAAARLASRAVADPDALLSATLVTADHRVHRVDIPIRLLDWNTTEPIVTLDSSRFQAPGLGVGRSVVYAPKGDRYILERITTGDGGIDLFLVEGNSESRLTDTAGDDKLATWSPDGRMVAFLTQRWTTLYEIGLMDMETRSVARLTYSAGHEIRADWSPDGSRLATLRQSVTELRPSQVCWIARDGSRERCFDPVQGFFKSVHGWYDVNTVVVTVDNGTDGVIALLDVRSGDVRALPVFIRVGGQMSPDGRWLVCFCRNFNSADNQWLVVPMDQPRQGRPIIVATAGPILFNWDRSPRWEYVDSLTLQVPNVPLGSTHRAKAWSFGPHGQRVPIGLIQWTTSDTAVAVVDTNGVIDPRKMGPVTIHASAGGWRHASANLNVVSPTFEMAWSELWVDGFEPHWRPFGDPRPRLVQDRAQGTVMHVNGDGSFSSGAYRRLIGDARRGMGVEAMISGALTSTMWQYLSVSLQSVADTSWFEAWDHVTGSPGQAKTLGGYCGTRFPANDGFEEMNRVLVKSAGRERRLPTTGLIDGTWFRLQIQLFPDGRCGVAINGQPRWISEDRADMDRIYLLMLSGNAVDTDMLIGPIEVWSGVRTNLNWASISDHPHPVIPGSH